MRAGGTSRSARAGRHRAAPAHTQDEQARGIARHHGGALTSPGRAMVTALHPLADRPGGANCSPAQQNRPLAWV